jgi:hypothetical protein
VRRFNRFTRTRIFKIVINTKGLAQNGVIYKPTGELALDCCDADYEILVEDPRHPSASM